MVDEVHSELNEIRWPIRAHVRLATILGGVGGVLAVLLWLVAPRQYASTSQIILPTKREFQLPGALAAIGGQLGFPGSEAVESPYFVEALLQSRDVLTAVVIDTFTLDDGSQARTLVEVLTRRRPDSPRDIARARRRLARRITTRVSLRTDIIEVEIEMPDPRLAQAVQSALLQEADRANRRIHQTQARHHREFIESRLELAGQKLRDAEDAQRLFHERNARFEQAPDLVLAERRLQREVLSRQELFTSLARDLEETLQDESSEIPSLSVVTAPDLPWQKSWPSGTRLVIAGFGVGVVLATLLTFVALRYKTHQPSLELNTPRSVLTAARRALYQAIRAVV